VPTAAEGAEAAGKTHMLPFVTNYANDLLVREDLTPGRHGSSLDTQSFSLEQFGRHFRRRNSPQPPVDAQCIRFLHGKFAKSAVEGQGILPRHHGVERAIPGRHVGSL
jgi:hypothetical protein